MARVHPFADALGVALALVLIGAYLWGFVLRLAPGQQANRDT